MEDLETVEFADVLGAIAEDHHLTRRAQACFTGTEEDQGERHDHGTIDEVLMSWMKLTEKLIFLNKYLFVVTQSERKSVQHLGFVFLAELASLSDGCIETCDIVQMLCAARASQDYINAAKTFRCLGDMCHLRPNLLHCDHSPREALSQQAPACTKFHHCSQHSRRKLNASACFTPRRAIKSGVGKHYVRVILGWLEMSIRVVEGVLPCD